MRKAKKKQAESFLVTLGQAHDELRKLIEQKNNTVACGLLADCQEGAIKLGNLIEMSEGEGFITISYIEKYCELTYHIHEQLVAEEDVNANKVYKNLRKLHTQIFNSVKNDIKVQLEMVFLPYKASMWDSLESVWMAANTDPNCNAYVMPIPYYDRNADGTLGTYHYEGSDFPENVPIIYYENYNLKERQPDVVYIHNPYDNGNYVTSIDPRYYSAELKKYTECLVYIPYYITSGGMSEGQAFCQAYLNADYIVIQSEKYRKFFHPIIPKEKFLPLGSPKSDKVIRLCNNPPEPPEAWKKQMVGKKVYFYNTSINGMLGDTRAFLKKMEYVFKCFQGREDACLLWRPHPLLESTFGSMRKELRLVYDELKQYFIQNNIGIYDDTPDIEKTIALCDAYIGDSGTSVTSLFGIAGKPLFILNNYINTLPEEDDWRGEIIREFFVDGHDEWMITQGNKLYYASNSDYHYEYYCDLSEYAFGNYYLKALEINGKIYVCPANAQDILVISERKIIKKIDLERQIERTGAFCDAWNIGNYLFLIPNKYPAIVRYDIQKERVDYLKGYNELFVQNVQGEWRIGGRCVWNNYLFLASPIDNRVLAIESKSMKVEVLTTGASNACGCIGIVPYEDGICIMPYTGNTITCWNPITGVTREYNHMPQDLYCTNRPHGYKCLERPFYLAAIYKNKIVLPPFWGNLFVSVDMETEEVTEWEPPFTYEENGKNGYFQSWCVGLFLRRTDTLGEGTFRFYYEPERSLYDINIETKEYKKIEILFDKKELLLHEPGFDRFSDWLKYGCYEKALYTLQDFLDGTGKGKAFNREKQIQAYGEITANHDGTCGSKIYQFIQTKLQ